MNFVPSLNSVICHGCAGEFAATALNESGLCRGCRVDVQMAVDAERFADFRNLAHEALVERVVERAQARAKSMHPTTYSESKAS